MPDSVDDPMLDGRFRRFFIDRQETASAADEALYNRRDQAHNACQKQYQFILQGVYLC